jgi:flavin-dependent dehydrogenase
VTEHYDVIVAGGGSGGVAAAVGASRAGARTLLIERGPCLGGAATLRNVVTYCGLYTRDDKRQAVFGVADEVITAQNGSPTALSQRFRCAPGVCPKVRRKTSMNALVDAQPVRCATAVTAAPSASS